MCANSIVLTTMRSPAINFDICIDHARRRAFAEGMRRGQVLAGAVYGHQDWRNDSPAAERSERIEQRTCRPTRARRKAEARRSTWSHAPDAHTFHFRRRTATTIRRDKPRRDSAFRRRLSAGNDFSADNVVVVVRVQRLHHDRHVFGRKTMAERARTETHFFCSVRHETGRTKNRTFLRQLQLVQSERPVHSICSAFHSNFAGRTGCAINFGA